MNKVVEIALKYSLVSLFLAIYSLSFGMENWKKIEGYKNYYVSSHGKVKTTDYNHTGQEKTLSVFKNSYGYIACNLMQDGVRKRKLVHRLVAKAFHPLSERLGDTVNHKDGNKENNFYQNLEWCSIQDNLNHAMVNGLRGYASGETHYKAKIPSETIVSIKLMLSKNMKGRDIASAHGVGEKFVSAIKRGITRKHE